MSQSCMSGEVLDQIGYARKTSLNARMSNRDFNRDFNRLFRRRGGNSGSCAAAMVTGRSKTVLRKGLVFRDDSHLLAEGVKTATDHDNH